MMKALWVTTTVLALFCMVQAGEGELWVAGYPSILSGVGSCVVIGFRQERLCECTENRGEASIGLLRG